MSDGAFYTDRVSGPTPQVHESLPAATSAGLVSLMRRRIAAHWLAEEFPDECPDGNGVAGTDTTALAADIEALIPDVEWPLSPETIGSDEAIFDLVEYVAARTALPEKTSYHAYFRHYELTFDADAGKQRFRQDVNLILRRGGTVFELSESLQIERHGSPELENAFSSLRPTTGDATFDALVERARSAYLSRHPDDRETAIEKLWDAFERLKTLDDPSDKKRSTSILLANVSDTAMREVIESEMHTLTKFGNNFAIRHHEVGKNAVPLDSTDYIAARMVSLLVFLLGQSGRLAKKSA